VQCTAELSEDAADSVPLSPISWKSQSTVFSGAVLLVLDLDAQSLVLI